MVAALLVGMLGSTAWVSAEPVEEVEVCGPCTMRLRLAIPGDSSVDDVLRRDAEISGGFEVLDLAGLSDDLRDAPAFDKRGWSNFGAQAVILSRPSGDQIRFELYDLARGNRPVLSVLLPAASRRDAAHRFVNRVLEYYTGVPGVFGSRIAYVRTWRHAAGVSKNVYVADMDGSREREVTDNRSLNVLPSLGPAGELLFTSWAKRNPDLWISVRGRERRVSAEPGLNLGGAMSPDGRTIAVALSRDGNSELYALDREGAVQTRLTRSPSIDGSPTWNPDGTQIAFMSDRSGEPQIHRLPARGGRATRVTTRGHDNEAPDWNPGISGSLVAYAGRVDDRFQIFSVNVDTGRTRQLTVGTKDHVDPSWSPDGRMLAYSTNSDVVVIDADGGNPTRVIAGGTMPDWGPSAY